MEESKRNQIGEKLELSEIKLDALLKVTIGINENLSKDELLQIYSSVLLNDLKIGKVGLFICSIDDIESCFVRGFQKEKINALDWNKIPDLIKSIHVTNQNDPEFIHPFEVVIPIFHQHQDIAYLLLSDFEDFKNSERSINQNLKFIQTLTNIIVVAFENKRFYQDSVKKATLQQEMDLAKKMQQLLIPSELIHNNYYQFSSLYLPFNEVGGDYFDVIQLTDNRVGFCIADVSGKGISAALLMANFQANIRALIQVSKSLEELVVRLNKKVIASGGMEKFITLFVGVYDPQTRELSTINCGHNPPILYQNNSILELQKGTTILGMFDVLPEVSVEKHYLEHNAKLLCYTDGISEITNSSGEEFGTKQLIEIVANYPPKEITEMLKLKADQFRGSSILPDDITLLSCIFY